MVNIYKFHLLISNF